MELTAATLAPGWLGLGAVLAGTVLVTAARTAPWSRLRSAEMQHAFAAGCVAVMLLWTIRTGLEIAPGYHFFGVTTLTLMFGWQLACLASVPVLIAACLLGHGDWAALGANALVLFVLPAAVTWALLRVVRRWLPRNFFVYIYLNAYLGAACAMAAGSLAMAAILAAAGTLGDGVPWRDYLLFLPLLSLAEGFINGIVLTVLVAIRPHWVWTFDEARYFA